MAIPVNNDSRQLASMVEEIEVELLLEGIFRMYGHDFRGYEPNALRIRLAGFIGHYGLHTVSSVQEKIMHDPAAADQLFAAFVVQRHTLISDPAAFLCLREVAVPLLRSYARPKIWMPEVSAPEDVLLVAILLKEAGVFDKSTLYVTNSNQKLLKQAQEKRIDRASLTSFEEGYRLAGGTLGVSDYWDVREDHAWFSAELRRNITWSQYNLATDTSFNEFQLIISRDRLHAFGEKLCNRVLSLYGNSLAPFGILFTDPVSQFNHVPYATTYKALSQKNGIYRRTSRLDLPYELLP